MIWEKGMPRTQRHVPTVAQRAVIREHRLHIHITRRRHKIIVASGIIACGVVTICWPEQYHISGSIGTSINLIWLLVEPTA